MEKQNQAGQGISPEDMQKLKERIMKGNVIVEEIEFKPCRHYGFYFKHWFKTYFVCIKCGTVFTKKQIEFYKKFNKNQTDPERKEIVNSVIDQIRGMELVCDSKDYDLIMGTRAHIINQLKKEIDEK